MEDILKQILDELQALNKRMENFEASMINRFEVIDERIDIIDERTDGVTKEIEALDGRTDVLDERIDAMNKNIIQVGELLEQIKDKL